MKRAVNDPTIDIHVRNAAALLGSVKSEKKAAAARRNGKRPKRKKK